MYSHTTSTKIHKGWQKCFLSFVRCRAGTSSGLDFPLESAFSWHRSSDRASLRPKFFTASVWGIQLTPSAGPVRRQVPRQGGGVVPRRPIDRSLRTVRRRNAVSVCPSDVRLLQFLFGWQTAVGQVDDPPPPHSSWLVKNACFTKTGSCFLFQVRHMNLGIVTRASVVHSTFLLFQCS